MKKLNILLNETSIIDFAFLGRLFKRYKYVTLIVPIIVLSIGVIKYRQQQDIYEVQTGFKNQAADSSNPSNALMAILGENTSKMDPSEITSLSSNLDFQQKLAEKLYNDNLYLKLNYNPILTKHPKPVDSFFSHCHGKKECIIYTVSRKLSSLYRILEDPKVLNRFIIRVRSLDRESSKILARKVAETVQEDRIKTIKYFISEQIKLSEELVSKKKGELESQNISQLLEQQERLKESVLDISNKISQSRTNYFRAKSLLSRAELVFKETKETLNKKYVHGDKLKTKKAIFIENEIKKLEEDLNSLELVKDSFSMQDNQVLMQIKAKLKKKRRELKRIGKIDRSLANVDDFLVKKKNKSKNEEFDYKVIKEEFHRAEADYNSLIKEKEEILKKASKVSVQVEKHKPLIEYVKLLEGNKIKLRMAEATVVSDLLFERNISGVRKYKKETKAKTAVTYLAMSFFILFLITVGRYLFDGRIYDEFELKKNFKDLEIIGNTPDFQ